MTYGLKKIWLIGLAILALGALYSAPASAEFHSSVEHTILDGKQIGGDQLVFNAGAVTCSEVTYIGTQSVKTTSTMSLTPAYSGCNAFGFKGVAIDVNGCQFVLHETLPNEVDISCPGSPIEITGPNCTLTIGSQFGLTAATYSTEGATPKQDVKLKLNLASLRYTQHGKGATPCTSAAFTDGAYTAEATVTGRDTGGGQVDFWFKPLSIPPGKFHSSVEHTIFGGSQVGEDTATFNAGTYKCSSITYSGTQAYKTPSSIRLAPTYSGCSGFGLESVNSNGCHFALQVTTVDISCPSAPMEIKYFNCTVTVGSQTGVPSATYATQGASPKRDIKVSLKLTGIKYTQDPKSFPFCTAGPFTNGTYVGEATITGRDTLGNQVDLWYA